MHEMSLLRDLMNKIDAIATDNEATRVTRVCVRIGALAHISADHFRDHFVEAARNTQASDAELDVIVSTDTEDPDAQSILLDSIDVE